MLREQVPERVHRRCVGQLGCDGANVQRHQNRIAEDGLQRGDQAHAWVMHARRHARDYERLIQHSESLITWAAITLMTRRITRRSSRRSGQPASREAHRD